jgi:hypothetical protein
MPDSKLDPVSYNILNHAIFWTRVQNIATKNWTSYNILNPGFIILWLRYNESGFKILWLRNIEPPYIIHRFRILWLWDNDPLLVFIVRRRGSKILWLHNIEPLPPYTIRVGIQNIVVARYWPPVGFHDVRRRGFKILWPRYIESPSPNILRVGIQRILVVKQKYWFSWLRGGGSKYYGCDILNPPPQTF